MSTRQQRSRKLERVRAHERFCKARDDIPSPLNPSQVYAVASVPRKPRQLRRRLLQAGRSQWHGRANRTGEIR